MDTYNRDREIREAIYAGERALLSLQNAKSELDSARGWGVVDILGGGFFTNMIKHSKISNAKNSIEQSKQDLIFFRRELADVRELTGLNVEIGDFMTFADFFFDDALMDMYVQSKINKARGQVDNAISVVTGILSRLRSVQ